MSAPTPEAQLEELLDFFYRTPVGLIDFADDGGIRRLNPAAVNLLAPILGADELDNVFRLLAGLWPELCSLVGRAERSGRLVDDHHLLSDEPDRWALACTVVRLGVERNMLVVTDGTTRIRAERQRDELLASERAARQRIEVLERNATHVASATTVEEVVSVVLEELQGALGLDLATINVVHEESIRVFSGVGIPDEVSKRIETVPVDADLPGAVAIRLNEAIHLTSPDEIRSRFPILLSDPERFPLEALVALPLRAASKRAIGALMVTTPRADILTDEVQLLLDGIAGQIGQALERAQLYERVSEGQRHQRAVAMRLQEALLPDEIVDHPEVSIAARYSAASDDLTVGGDWFDTFAWPDGRVGVIVGDVVGHDLDAAATMGRLRAAVAALAPRLEPEPGAILAALDEFAAGPDGTRFATACCVIIDPSTGAIDYASAGHPPPLVVSPTGATRWLDGALSPPIGPIRPQHRPTAVAIVEPGEIAVIYSDGLVEQRRSTLDAGLTRLARVARRAQRSDTGRLADHLIAAMTAGVRLEDDIICVTVAWQPARAIDRVTRQPARRPPESSTGTT